MAAFTRLEARLDQMPKELISEHAFKVVLWVGVGLCAVTCMIRFCIRIVCFRKLFIEDYFMGAAMFVLIAMAVVLQLFLGDLYNGLILETRREGLPERMAAGLKGDAIAIVLGLVGLWLIKANFLLLFYRIGYQIRTYLILWWVASGLVIICGLVSFGLVPYDCLLGSISHITVTCARDSRVNPIYTHYAVLVVVDVLSDLIIVCFPILIVWKTGLNWRQKIALSGVFLLVSFSIGVTIARGTMFGRVYGRQTQINRRVIDSSLFWYVEYIVSFVIACLISFRSLWTSREQRTPNYQRAEAGKELATGVIFQNSAGAGDNSLRRKWMRLYGNLLTTFADLEDTTMERHGSLQIQSHLTTMNLNFSTFGKSHSAEDTVGNTRDII